MPGVTFRLSAGSLLAWLAVAAPLSAAEPEYRVLFLGNSIFKANGGSPKHFENLCKEAGIDVVTESPPRRIDPYVRTQANDPDIASLIGTGHYTHVVLATRLSDFLSAREQSASIAGFKKLHTIIARSGARTVISMSYPTRNEEAPFDKVRRGHEALQRQLNALKIDGELHPVTLVPIGAFWIEAKREFGPATWYSDDLHGASLAQFANGCLWYAYLTERDPRASMYGDKHQESEWIKRKVWEYHSASVAGIQPPQ